MMPSKAPGVEHWATVVRQSTARQMIEPCPDQKFRRCYQERLGATPRTALTRLSDDTLRAPMFDQQEAIKWRSSFCCIMLW